MIHFHCCLLRLATYCCFSIALQDYLGRMGTTSSLPDEVLTSKGAPSRFLNDAIISNDDFTPNVASYCFQRKEDLLALRATSKSGLALARRGLLASCSSLCRHLQLFPATNGEESQEMRASARQVEATGRVFGAGCIWLIYGGMSPERIAALESFVRRTNGGLRVLDLYATSVTAEALLRMCRISPKLNSLQGPSSVAIPDTTMISISAACPDLNSVGFSQVGRAHSPAETWQRHFPRLRRINLIGGGSPPYLPTRIDAIRETALTCRHATSLRLDGCHITADVIEALVGTPLGDSLSDLGEELYDEATILEPGAILAAVRGFPKLYSLKILRGSTMPGPGFYIDLSRTTARITDLQIQDDSTTDACIAAACSHLRLKSLELEFLDLLTSGIVDGITRSQSAATLWSLKIAYSADNAESPLRAEDVLRLLSFCPNLTRLSWSLGEYDRARAGLDRWLCRLIVDLLKDRGARIDRCFDELDPEVGTCIVDEDCIFESW